MSKKLLAIVLTVVMVLGVLPMLSLFASADLTWTVADGVLTVEGGAVPSYASDALATRPWAADIATVTKIVIKGDVGTVGDRAFTGAEALEELVLEEGVTSLGFDSFSWSGPDGGIDVTLPTTLVTISQGAFYGTAVDEVIYVNTSRDFAEQCTMGAYNDNLTNATWVNDPDWGSSGDLSDDVHWAFDADTGTLTLTGTGAIPQPATKPWQSYVSQITKIVIGEGLTEIPGGGLFSHVDNLDHVELAETITKIGGDAFAYNGTISYFKLSSNVTSISQGVLYATGVTTISCKKDWRAIQQQASVGAYNDAFGTATWVDVEIYGSFLSFGKYGDGMEIWSNDTQILICPKWDGVWNADFKNACMNQAWTLTFESELTQPETTHVYPGTCYDGGSWGIVRFMPATASDPADRFVPIPGLDYTVTATMTYNGVTNTVTSADTFKLPSNATPVTYDTFYEITWMIDGVVEYTENVPEGKKPTYHGAAADYQEGNIAYVANIPATTEAFGNATYNITYTATDVTSGTLALWGSGYENWAGGTGGTQTQLLLRPKDWKGNDLEAYNGSAQMAAVDWILTINGVDYTVKPSSHYAAMIYRFEPDLWETPLLLQPGTAYSVSLTIKNANDEVEFYTTAPTTITIAADFAPVHTHRGEYAVEVEGDCTTDKVEAFVCSACGERVERVTTAPGHAWDEGVVTAEATETVPGTKVFTCTVCGETREETIQCIPGLVTDSKGTRYYENGEYVTGWVTFGDSEVYFKKANGYMNTTKAKIAGEIVYFEAFEYEGNTLYRRAAKNGLIEDPAGVIRCYEGEELVTGWYEVDGSWLYFKKTNGVMVTGPAKISGRVYTFEAFEYNGMTLYRAVGDVVIG